MRKGFTTSSTASTALSKCPEDTAAANDSDPLSAALIKLTLLA